jgi:hypothetical protein
MVTKKMDRMVLNHLKTLPTFHGNEDEDAIQWLKDITDGLNYVKFTDDQKVAFIVDYLADNARRWLLSNVSVVDSWSTFLQAFKTEFVPTLLKEATVSQIDECVYVSDIIIFTDNNIEEEHKCELLEEKEVPFDYLNITLAESTNLVSYNTCLVESDETNFETVWPDGSEWWLIHNKLPQRHQFIRYKQEEVLFKITSNTDNNFSQEITSNCINVLSWSIMNDVYFSANYNINTFNNLLKLHTIYNDVISFYLFSGKLSPIINICHRIFTTATLTLYFCHNSMPWTTKDRDWFRCLAVP